MSNGVFESVYRVWGLRPWGFVVWEPWLSFASPPAAIDIRRRLAGPRVRASASPAMALSSTLQVVTCLAVLLVGSGASYADLLRSFTFLHEGNLSGSTRHLNLRAATAYVECENCTLANYSWGNSRAQGNAAGNCDWFEFLFQEQPEAAKAPVSLDFLEGVDFPGGDYRQTQEASEAASAQACAASCASEPRCVAFTWAEAIKAPWGNCTTRGPCCFLKDVLPLPTYTPGLTSAHSPRYVAPSMGVRSSIALGGVGTGSFELRGDGSLLAQHT